MDPVTAIGIATTAYKTIVSGFKVGKQVESMSKDLGRWMGAIQAVKDGHKKKKSRSFGSVEEEALETFAALKEARQAQIRKDKKEAEEEAKRKQRKIVENTIIGGCVLFFVFFIIYIVYLVINV